MPYRQREPGIHQIWLANIPVGAVTVMLEGLDAKDEVVALISQDLELTGEPATVTFAPPIPEVEGLEDLGFGFRMVGTMEAVRTDFESLGHFGYLYYHDQRLCDLGRYSVSPSGNYVIFQEGSSGNLFLYRRADGQRTQLTRKFVALIKYHEGFEWDENAGTVTVHFDTGLSESYSIRTP